ncbi:hypothetical protein MTR67_044554 [Solanum verrucosum]|uniref:Uncharacterized protein n=1 Tax=Solanum verrucosum TaxID=315347 RepID=A0AAF0PRT4_SOLVR|nr:hypothetical protein MTR67_003108 [Solanum verrucosum]WMV51169.1 hypothetical protein MTR67_044554 [Solanum verrucosum]
MSFPKITGNTPKSS